MKNEKGGRKKIYGLLACLTSGGVNYHIIGGIDAPWKDMSGHASNRLEKGGEGREGKRKT